MGINVLGSRLGHYLPIMDTYSAIILILKYNFLYFKSYIYFEIIVKMCLWIFQKIFIWFFFDAFMYYYYTHHAGNSDKFSPIDLP